MKSKLIFILVVVWLFLLYFLSSKTLPGFNADEAAFGYNAYSILETGKDEYGTFLPLRLKSFGDYKLPLYSYLSVPFIMLFGLNEVSTRMVGHLSGIFLVFVIYLITKQAFKKKWVANVSIIFAAVSTWVQITSQHAHETTLATLLIGLSFYFLLRFVDSQKLLDMLFSFLLITTSLFAYHTTKIIFFPMIVILLYTLIKHHTIKKIKFKFNLLLALLSLTGLLILGLFVYSELRMPAKRVNNLLVFNHSSISLTTKDAATEFRFTPFAIKDFVAGMKVINNYLSYFSPEFLIGKGDPNPRFGYPNISLITFVQFIFLGFGVFQIFIKKQKKGMYLLILLLVVPFGGALAWQEYAYTRVHPMILGLIPIASYGIYETFREKKYLATITVIISIFISLTSLFYYFVHYPRKAVVAEAWQAGYKELVTTVNNNLNKYDNFYITKKHGQPYIFFLFYNQYLPGKYQAEASLSKPDEYGFGQVESFSKYQFNFVSPANINNSMVVGYPDDFTSLPESEKVEEENISKIIVNNHEIFWLYTPKN
jgi:4-amino-4-deoxy-L-arabinose transferase-like glycosyltransferase